MSTFHYHQVSPLAAAPLHDHKPLPPPHSPPIPLPNSSVPNETSTTNLNQTTTATTMVFNFNSLLFIHSSISYCICTITGIEFLTSQVINLQRIGTRHGRISRSKGGKHCFLNFHQISMWAGTLGVQISLFLRKLILSREQRDQTSIYGLVPLSLLVELL